MQTLFDLPEIEAPEQIITRYVIVVTDLSDNTVSYYRQERGYGDVDSIGFVELSEPIKTRGMKLPKMYKSYHGASDRVTNLYSRHKKGGEGIRINVEKWTRKANDKEWARGV